MIFNRLTVIPNWIPASTGSYLVYCHSELDSESRKPHTPSSGIGRNPPIFGWGLYRANRGKL